jgi:Raf kinase inhibitor-like YbhB/YbcL family protein
MKRCLLLICALTLVLSACRAPEQIPIPVTQEVPMSISLTSSAFQPGQDIPADYTCKGRDISPALSWGEPPAGTQSLALIMDDPDAPMGTWVHWVIFNIPAASRGLAEGVPSGGKLADGSLQGNNSSRNQGYNGPCPPSGTHRYFFKLYALDAALELNPGATKEQLLAAMQGHILAQGELMGTFGK